MKPPIWRHESLSLVHEIRPIFNKIHPTFWLQVYWKSAQKSLRKLNYDVKCKNCYLRCECRLSRGGKCPRDETSMFSVIVVASCPGYKTLRGRIAEQVGLTSWGGRRLAALAPFEATQTHQYIYIYIYIWSNCFVLLERAVLQSCCPYIDQVSRTSWEWQRNNWVLTNNMRLLFITNHEIKFYSS